MQHQHTKKKSKFLRAIKDKALMYSFSSARIVRYLSIAFTVIVFVQEYFGCFTLFLQLNFSWGWEWDPVSDCVCGGPPCTQSVKTCGWKHGRPSASLNTLFNAPWGEAHSKRCLFYHKSSRMPQQLTANLCLSPGERVI